MGEMPRGVPLHVGICGEPLVAVVTSVRFLSSVLSDMHSQVGIIVESPPAKAASKWHFPGMDPDVPGQLEGRVKALHTEVTREWVFPRVGLNVHAQRIFPGEALSAKGACVRQPCFRHQPILFFRVRASFWFSSHI